MLADVSINSNGALIPGPISAGLVYVKSIATTWLLVS
jgi:hypothetical protein